MTSDISADGLVKVYEALVVKPEVKVAVKMGLCKNSGCILSLKCESR